MDNTFYSYMDNTEKQFAMIEAESNIELEKLYLSYEYVSRLHDIKLMQSDLKVLTESGTYEDIDALYMEAGEEAGEKKKNIISRIIDAISNLIDKIVSGVKNLFKGKKEKEVEDALRDNPGVKIKAAMKDPKKVFGIFKKAGDDVMHSVNPGKPASMEDADKVGKIVKGAVASVGAVAAVSGAVFAQNAWATHKEATSWFKTFKDWLGKMKASKANNKSNENDEGTKSILQHAQSLISNCGGFIGKWASGAFSAIFGGKNKANDTTEPETETKTSSAPKPERPAGGYGEQNSKSDDYIDLDDETEYGQMMRSSAEDEPVDGDAFTENEELQSTIDELRSLFNDEL